MSEQIPGPTGQAWYQTTCADLAPKHVQIGAAQRATPNATAYAVFAKSALLWDNGTNITYCFLSGANVGTTNQQTKVSKYISEWTQYAGVTFSLVDPTASPPPLLRITFDSTTGNWSAVGNFASGIPPDLATMNLGWVYDDASDHPYEKGVIMHQFGHALGLTHEHNVFLALNPSATKSFYEFSQGWSEAKVQNNILDVYDASNLTNFAGFDHKSVMKYFMAGQMNADQHDIYPNNELSDHDKAFMVINYPRSQLDPNASQWSLSHALDAMSVPSLAKHAMLLARPDDVRKQFAVWLAEQVLDVPDIGVNEYDGPSASADVGDGNPRWFSKACSDLMVHEKILTEDNTPSRVARAVFTKSSLLWDNSQTITYSFMGGNQIQKDKVDAVVPEWTKYANIQFIKVDSDGEIRITFNSSDGSWSYVGKETLDVASKKATMNFGWVDGTTRVIDEEERGVILHEFGHALGLLHEHQSPARGGTLTLDEASVYDYYSRTQGWSRATIKEQIIDIYNDSEVSNYSALDTTSVMMYFMPKEMNRERIGVEPNYVLSDLDKAYMVINYPFQTRDSRWTLGYALQVAGVTGETKEIIANQRSADVIRQKFSVWTAARKAQEVPSVSRGLDGRGRDEDEDNEVVIGEDWCSSEDPEFLEEETRGGVARAAAVGGDQLWDPGATITYWFEQAEYRAPRTTPGRACRRQCLWDAFAEWTMHSKIQFAEAGAAGGADVHIWFHERGGPHAAQSPGGTSWCKNGKSCIGYVNELARGGTAQTSFYVYLPDGPWGADSANDVLARRHCRHEIGHMLGLRHEQANPNSEAIDPANEQTHTIAIWTDWDPKSIMLYQELDLYINGPRPRKKAKRETQWNTVLSKRDKYFIAALYARTKQDLRAAIVGLRLPQPAIDAVMDVAAAYDGGSDRQRRLTIQNTRRELARQLFLTYGPADHPNPPRALGLGAVEEDILSREHWCGTEDPGSHGTVARSARGGPARAASAGNSLLWQSEQLIPYYFQQEPYRDDVTGNDLRRARLRILNQAFREWSEISGVTFFEVDSPGQAFVKIFVHEYEGEFQPQSISGISWCKIGKECIQPNYVNDAAKRGGYPDTTFYIWFPNMIVAPDSAAEKACLRFCRHEIGHLLGLRHEHFSYLSPTEVPTDTDETSDGISIWTDWDPLSIMLYPNIPFKTTESERKVPMKKRRTDPEKTKINLEISYRDRNFVKALYARNITELGDAMEALFLSEEARGAVKGKIGIIGPGNQWDTALERARLELANQLWLKYGPADKPPPQGLNPSKAGRAPARDAGPLNPTITPGGPDFLTVIISSLQKFFNPGGNQIFTLQFPGRFLQISQYAWDTGSAGVYGQFIKPIVVNESEFRLTDQLYDVAEVVSGPNGISLSQVYDQIINNLLPVFRSNGLAQQQDQIRQWLLREVKTAAWIRQLLESQHTVDPSSIDDSDDVDDEDTTTAGGPAFAISNKLSEEGTVNRMELSNALMQEYLQAKQAWEVERDGMIEQALHLKLGTQESAEALNSLTRKLAHTTATREAQLAAKYSDAVVRGYSHNVREYVGYLDVKSASEALQDAKDALRESAMSSLDGSLNVYPVQMTPIDWFEGLSTSFKLEDLTQDPNLIFQQIRTKSQQLDVLNQQLTALRFGSKGDPVNLRNAVNTAQQNLDNAQSNLALKYSSNIIAMVKTCYTSDGALDEGQVEGLVDKGDIAGVVLDTLISDMRSTSAAQTDLTNASRAYSQALAGYALAEATDTQQQQEQIRLRIESLTGDVNELTARYTSLNRADDRPRAHDVDPAEQVSIKDVLNFPAANDTAGGSRWQQIQFDHQLTSEYSQSTDISSANASSIHVNLWLASASTNQSTVQAKATTNSGSYTNNITVAFRATLVTVDRAGWFQPQFFKQSGSFYHIDPAVSWSEARGGSQPLLQAFPIGYILCKDITIKIRESFADTRVSKQKMSEEAAASGGILCFSYSQSSSSSSEDNSYSFQSCSDGCVIRIPGPQILGYIMQLTDKDNTTMMPKKLPADFFIPDADYDAVTRDTGDEDGPDRAANPNGGGKARSGKAPVSPFFKEIDEILKKSNVSAKVLEGVHEAMQREFNVISDEVATRVKLG